MAGVPGMVPDLKAVVKTNGNNVTLTLSWGEPFNNLDPIVNYTVSCSGDVICPPNFTTTDNTTRNYTITNLTTMTTYTFSVVATNSIGSGEAGVVNVLTSPIIITTISSEAMTTTRTTSANSMIAVATTISSVGVTAIASSSISTTTVATTPGENMTMITFIMFM